MAYELYLRVYDRAGVLKKGFVPVIWARYTDEVNSAEPLVFAMNVETDGATDFAEFDIIEVMIRNLSLNLASAEGGFVRSYLAILRDWVLSTDENGVSFIEFTAPGINHILDLRSIEWYSGTVNRSTFENVAAETILKLLVAYNCTALASISNGRLRNGDLLPGMGYDIQLGYDYGAGNISSISFRGGRLLASLQKVINKAGGDFGLTWLGGDDWLFEFYPGQLGVDKSSGSDQVVFSLEKNTMRNPRLFRTGAKASVAISAGEGRGNQRETSTVFGDDYALNYDIETFVDARQEKTAAGRVYRGNLKLADKRIQERLEFEIIQTGDQFYSPIEIAGRKTFKPGDLALAVYPDDRVVKIEAVNVYWSDPSAEDAFIVDITTREVVLDGS